MQFLKDCAKTFVWLGGSFLLVEFGMYLFSGEMYRSPLKVLLYAAGISFLLNVFVKAYGTRREKDE